jgi:hypothetical protein
MPHKIIKGIICIFTIALLFQAPSLYSKDLSFTFLDIQKISSYDTDRIAYQQFEKAPDALNPDKNDNSLALLMIIKDKKIYVIQDGYDNPEQVYFNKISFNQGNQFIPNIWLNMIDGKPDSVMVTDRRIEVQRNTDKDWVAKNYNEMYAGVRDKFIKKHVTIFLSLIVNRKESDIVISRKLMRRKTYEPQEPRFAISVSARTNDGGTVYYAEDADGDGVTETFMVNCSDGFQWGYKSGPNIICIEKNTQKDIQQMIGRLTNLAYYGTQEEAEIIKKSLPTTDKIDTMINSLYNIDAETDKLLKKNGIDIDKNVEESSKPEGK